MVRSRKRRLSTRDRVGLAVLVVLLVAVGGWAIRDARQPGPWQHVFATREGMIGGLTSSRTIIRPESRFVALPHPRALGRLVEVRYRDRALVVPVLDVGPWNVDDAYWETSARPASERGSGAYRTPVNHAGIDLSNPVFDELGLRDNAFVEWRFVHKGYISLPRL
jgi:hypothetical protein